MHTRIVVLACGACLLAGVVTGVAIGRVGDPPAGPEHADRALDPARREPSGSGAGAVSSGSGAREPGVPTGAHERGPRGRPAREGGRTRSSASAMDHVEPEASASGPHASADDEPEALEEELERLRQELAELRDEQREVMGEPLEPPADLEPRFGGSAMSGAVQGALGQANVSGEVEGTDCSEHPCIVFGRLEGDEEDMEEVERAAALSVYDGDILTLLFWATSVEEPGATPAETGLFALAFYSFEDRASRGEALDRRIRARTMEYWNHDRPGRATGESR